MSPLKKKFEAEILRDAAGAASTINIDKDVTLELEHYPGGGARKIVLLGRRRIPSLVDFLKIIYPRDHIISIRGNQWYDRNSISKNDSYSAADIAPHSITQQLQYKCPEDRKAMVEILTARIRRVTVASTIKAYEASWYFQPDGGSDKPLLRCLLKTNNVDDYRQFELGTTMAMMPGDILTGYTVDLSTAGTCDYELRYKLTEFDA